MYFSVPNTTFPKSHVCTLGNYVGNYQNVEVNTIFLSSVPVRVFCCVAGTPTPPQITTPPTEQNVPYESQANFTCFATGTPDPVYSWFKNGELIVGQNLPSLYFPTVLVSDRGLYSCAVTNSEDSDESEQVYLRITGKT